ncbi:MAG: MTH938/NDUFAF3 family protein [Methanocellales archaeon]|nr:MTH938/NDUFAF3 family protein [Methanocellales archaeon]
MMINKTRFGSIEIDRRTYDHDVWMFADGTIQKRDRGHEFTERELQMLLSKGSPKIVVIGTGQSGVLRLSPGVKRLADERGIEIISMITPRAIAEYNKKSEKELVAAAFHVTC